MPTHEELRQALRAKRARLTDRRTGASYRAAVHNTPGKSRTRVRRQVQRQGADALLKMLGVENDPRMRALVNRALQTNSAATVAELASMISEARAQHHAAEVESLRDAPAPSVSAEDAAVVLAGPSSHPERASLRTLRPPSSTVAGRTHAVSSNQSPA